MKETSMRKFLTAAVLSLGLVGAASAQGYGNNYNGYNSYNNGYQQNQQRDNCAKERRDGRTGGAVVGGLLGAIAGGAIGNNIDGNRFSRRGFRGGRGFGFRRDNSGRVATGAVLGGVLGAFAGSEVGRRNVKCNTYQSNVNQGYRGHPNVAPPTRTYQTQTYPVQQPTTVYRQPTTTRTVRTVPAPQPVYRNDELYGGSQSIPCENITRVTRLPDGRLIREEVQDCQQGEVWYERDGQRVQGFY